MAVGVGCAGLVTFTDLQLFGSPLPGMGGVVPVPPPVADELPHPARSTHKEMPSAAQAERRRPDCGGRLAALLLTIRCGERGKVGSGEEVFQCVRQFSACIGKRHCSVRRFGAQEYRKRMRGVHIEQRVRVRTAEDEAEMPAAGGSLSAG